MSKFFIVYLNLHIFAFRPVFPSVRVLCQTNIYELFSRLSFLKVTGKNKCGKVDGGS